MSVCCSQAQSPLPEVAPPALRKRSKGSSAKRSGVERLVPHRVGDYKVEAHQRASDIAELRVDHRVAAPRSTCMSWMIAFICATA
jgi:hypothetical protein